MDRRNAMAWVLSVGLALRLSQAKTLSELLAATLSVSRVSLAAIGRALTGPVAAKHRIKRTWRFVANQLRDGKNKRNGWSLRHTKITPADRLDRLLLILALAYWLLIGIGPVARQQSSSALWCSSNRRTECSVFTIGRILHDRLTVPAKTAIAAVLSAIVWRCQ